MNDRQRLALLESAVANLKRTKRGYDDFAESGRGTEWRAAMRKLRKLADDLEPDPLPALGPIRPGARSILQYQLTHNTDGVPRYIAFDDNWGAGAVAIAPEPLVVISPYTSANPGAAFYARGASGLKYWIGHVTRSPRIGTRFVKGQEVGRAVAIVGDDDEHVHWGINIEALAGAGKQLLYGETGHGPDYTYGSPTLGAQLRSLLA